MGVKSNPLRKQRAETAAPCACRMPATEAMDEPDDRRSSTIKILVPASAGIGPAVVNGSRCGLTNGLISFIDTAERGEAGAIPSTDDRMPVYLVSDGCGYVREAGEHLTHRLLLDECRGKQRDARRPETNTAKSKQNAFDDGTART